MQNGAFITLLNPAVSIILAASFLIVWNFQRDQRHLLLATGAYMASGTGFLMQAFMLPAGFEAIRLMSNGLFVVAGILLSAGIISRYGRRVPWLPLVLLGSGGMGVLAWYLLADPNLTMRIYAVNFALGGMSLLVAAELRSMGDKGPPASVLLVLALLSALNFLVRPLLTAGPANMLPDDLANSLYWTTAILSHGILSLLIALSLLSAAAMDVVARLRREAHIDKLGGILNRRGFEEAASVMVDRAVMRSLPITVLVADIDNFKQVNDLYGHDAGDNVIVAFSTLIGAAQASGGIAARIGGDEFAIVLAVDVKTARLFAEGVRTAFARIAISGVPANVGLSASFGLSARIGNEKIAPALRRADEALYRAKRSGRDCVRISYERVVSAPLAAKAS